MFSDGGGWPKMDVQLHLFLKTKFLFVLFSRTQLQLLNIFKIQFEAFKFKECPASPFDKKNKTPVNHSNGIPMATRKFRF